MVIRGCHLGKPNAVFPRWLAQPANEVSQKDAPEVNDDSSHNELRNFFGGGFQDNANPRNHHNCPYDPTMAISLYKERRNLLNREDAVSLASVSSRLRASYQ